MTASADPSTRFVLAELCPLLANLAALWAYDAVLAQRMEGELDREPYPVEPSRAGVPTISVLTGDGRRILLHSRYQPLEEAKRLIDGVELCDKTVLAVHGFGLGYHIQELFDRASEEALILVLEPDLRLVRTAFQHRDYSKLIRSGRVIFLPEADRAALLSRLGDSQAMVSAGFGFVAHPPSLQAHGVFHRQMQTLLGEFVDYCRTGINTLVLNSRRTCENVAKNLGHYVSTPSVSRLRGRHGGQPAIIVSAGPSLRKNKHLLKSAEGKAVIIAVQTTLQPLLDMGIEPHYVTSLDYHEISTRFYEKLPKGLRTELIAEPKASSAVLGLFPGRISLLGNDQADKLLSPLVVDKTRLRSGATVAHLAFYLAQHVGCDPIIFVGQDLGFSDGLCYMPGTSYEDVWRPELGQFCTMEMKQWEHIVRERPILRRIDDYQRRPMYTEERLFAYLQQFERDFAASTAKVIDASEGGAFKRGVTFMTLRDALDQYCQQPLRPVEDNYPAVRHDLLEACLEGLKKRRQEAERIGQIAKRTLPLLEEMGDCLEDEDKANRLIARIDAQRANMNELGACYELVTELTQRTEMQRFQSDRKIIASKVSGRELQRRQLQRDMANVQGIIDAAGEFGLLMGQVIEFLAAKGGKP